jgi:hypothetical protein
MALWTCRDNLIPTSAERGDLHAEQANLRLMPTQGENDRLTPGGSRGYQDAAEPARIQRTADALASHGFEVRTVSDRAAAKRAVLQLLPDGAEVHQGSSATLDQTGLSEEVSNSGRYFAVRARTRTMDRGTQAREIRKLAAGPDYMLGSVHAVTESGTLLVASNSGSQLGAYAAGAGQVILVVGSQKIVADLDEGLRRIHDYCYPLEDARARRVYGRPSYVSKLLIVHRETVAGRVTVVLVEEPVGV